MDDQNTTSEPVAETPVQAPEPAPTPVEPESSQPNGSTPDDLPPEAPESSINAPAISPVESQNGGVNQAESDTVESSNEAPISEPVQSVPTESAPSPSLAPAPLTPPAPQPQSPAQQDRTGFIHSLLIKAQAKIQSNKQKKLDKIVLYAQKKKIIANEDIQKLLHISSATATRYLVKLVQQGRLARIGNPRDAKYQFVH
jgi:hypothetical protein